MTTLRHGTPTRYTAGCRCDGCRNAHKVEGQRVRDRARSRAVTDPAKIPHGTKSGYTYWKCRCDRCKDAKAGRI